jgi:hypothetical protein
MSPAEQLEIIANSQAGYFTAAQATDAGYPDSLHVYHTREGHWGKVQRGIYRLATFPTIDWPELVIWSLWSRDRAGSPQGVVADETALQLYGVVPRQPGPVVLMVPRSFRKNCETPEGLTLMKGDWAEDEVERRVGYRIVTLRKAVEMSAGRPDFEMILTRARDLPAYYNAAPAPTRPIITRSFDDVINAGED